MNKASVKQGIEKAFEDFKAAVKKHSDINKKRADGGWTVGEIANHIVKGTQTNLGPTAKTERPYDQHAAAIKDLFLNFEMKFPAAPFLQPDSKKYTIEEILAALDKSKKNIDDFVDNDDLTETFTAIPLPGWGALTKYEWLVLFENHIIRHTRQVNEFNNVAA